ncbi:5-hydroxytryptamine receptor 1D [Lutzomyia longipalpis]|uniref:5-hydroxytryptamine receptor 1D n=1 Tax=Lutzomyia longipalpis TaxID=7200 RepID=UPI0024843E70|nr:5-hydroxytryptamine receptor 1D [Lutzomyia longipalpis]
MQQIIVDKSLEILTMSQRSVLLSIVAPLVFIVILGNVTAIVVNIRRPLRLLFKSCLLSLSVSDLVTGIITSSAYISQFSTYMTQVWYLGDALCSLNAFLSTMAILANSFTLVTIALDRYMAIFKTVKGTWGSSITFCCIYIILLWAVSAGIASPLISSYFIVDILIIRSESWLNATHYELMEASLCLTQKENTGYYYWLLFTIVFLPLLLLFLWLNGKLAQEIWNRRKPIKAAGGASLNPSTVDTSSERKTTTYSVVSGPENVHSVPAKRSVAAKEPVVRSVANKSRKAQQMKMFKVVVAIIIVFFVCRLPTWIFLLIKLHNELYENYHWVLHFSFGILSLLNCAINPILYTFFSDSVKWAASFGNVLKRFKALFRRNKQESRVLSNQSHVPSPVVLKSKNTTNIGDEGFI